MGKNILQWIGVGVLSNPKGRKFDPLKYGDVLTEDILKKLGKKRVQQFIVKGKIGQVPMPMSPSTDDESAINKEALSALQEIHAELVKAYASIDEHNNELIIENDKITANNEHLTAEIEKMSAELLELKK